MKAVKLFSTDDIQANCSQYAQNDCKGCELKPLHDQPCPYKDSDTMDKWINGEYEWKTEVGTYKWRKAHDTL